MPRRPGSGQRRNAPLRPADKTAGGVRRARLVLLRDFLLLLVFRVLPAAPDGHSPVLASSIHTGHIAETLRGCMKAAEFAPNTNPKSQRLQANAWLLYARLAHDKFSKRVPTPRPAEESGRWYRIAGFNAWQQKEASLPILEMKRASADFFRRFERKV